MGIEPTYPAWKAGVLPLNYARKRHDIVPFHVSLVNIKKRCFPVFSKDYNGYPIVGALKIVVAAQVAAEEKSGAGRLVKN